MPVVLEARNLNKSFGAVTAAANINVRVEQDNVVGLIGRTVLARPPSLTW